MRWLLITNHGNPGDEAVRLGVERIIRSVDTSPNISTVERDHGNEISRPRSDFDQAIICGMPLIWSWFNRDREESTRHYGPWSAISGWLADSGKLSIAGFGIYLMFEEFPDRIQFPNEGPILEDLRKLFSKCRLVYSRSPLAKRYFPDIKVAPCPSVFAEMEGTISRELKLFNLMPGGAHYPSRNTDEQFAWGKMIGPVSCLMQERGFKFVAHHPSEADLAFKKYGWKKEDCFVYAGGETLRDAELTLRLTRTYARCSHYFGNRIHGAILARSFGASAWCMGYDTRLFDVQFVGGKVCTPTSMPSLEEIQKWIETATPEGLTAIKNQRASEFAVQRDWFRAL